ncbi:hypothetical protein N7509_008240 [Penicillium cosmopolitanum]|uniref:Uncharacterized protein n=1 Tax=Penicillium cosmopolitanum TaxID=1131564 RepID=A0A9X0B2F3_9EURO|nr:uncharacterized protein N7509_008240 [Penicillium cosmopolitanum]KAJ5385699.1 hypothetical protein N7509_008240 [Penicillium cosmopolitanum]
MHIINLLPEKVDVAWLYRVTPRWCVLHYIMQLTSVLLIAVFNQDLLNPRLTIGIGKKVEKAIQWIGFLFAAGLAFLQESSLSARVEVDLGLQEP